MAYVDSDLGAILTAIQARLVAQTATTGLTNDTCYLAPNSQAARLIPPNPGTFFCAVAAGDGEFDGELWDGGGVSQTALNFTVSVTIYSIIQLDVQGRNKQILTDATLGLSNKVKAILKVISAHELKNTGNDSIAERNRPQPVSMRIPDLGSPNIHGVTIDFRVGFDWDLS